ncbi:hypothetical protein [Streptomyces sp. NPDC049744]|uniref:hypothetical protein n=1 Tax=Streptomyces sp. NPDC049744 TaxID=3154359 RepID=UPI003442FCF5
MTSTPHPHIDCPACRARNADAREDRESAGDANERLHRDSRRRIADLEYGIDAALAEIADMDDDSDPRKVVRNIRHYLATYRAVD